LNRAPESRTYSNSCIIASRIMRERKQYGEALNMAYRAKNIGGSQTFSLIDCNITIGEAAYALERYGDAIAAFELALDLGRSSRKITAVCHLHLSRVHLANGQLSRAIVHFGHWELLEPELDNAFLTDLGNRVRQQLTPIREDFRIPYTVLDLNAKLHEHRLHKWLVMNALKRAEDDYRRAGVLLGGANKPYDKTTLQRWKTQGEEQEDDDSRAASSGA